MIPKLWLRLLLFLQLWGVLVAVTATSLATVAYDGQRIAFAASQSDGHVATVGFDGTEAQPASEDCISFWVPTTFLDSIPTPLPSKQHRLIAAEGTGARLALPAPSQVDYSWGALNTYKEGGQMTAMEHINYRHAFDSGFSDVSRYAEGTSARDIQGFVDQAARYGTVTPQGATGFKIEYNLGQTIGTGQAGEAASGIRVFIRDGQVKTAFPIAFP